MGAQPAADRTANLIHAADTKFIATKVKVTQLMSDSKQDSQLLQPQIDRLKTHDPPLAGIRSLDQPLQRLERGGLEAVSEQKALTFGKFLHRRDQPEDESDHLLQRRSGLAGGRVHCAISDLSKKSGPLRGHR